MSTLTFTINADVEQAKKAMQSLARSVTKIGKGAKGIAEFASSWAGVAQAATASTGALDTLAASLAPLAKSTATLARASKTLGASITAAGVASGAAAAPVGALAASMGTAATAATASAASVAGFAATATKAAGSAGKAGSAVKGLKSDLDETTKTATKANTELNALERTLAKLQKAAGEGRAFEELERRLEGVADEVVEFGGNGQDAQRALQAIGAEAQRTGKPMALTANAFRKLNDESEDVNASIKLLPMTMGIAQKSMLKTEDAGALMGRALKGDTAILKEMGGVSAKVAEQIDKIPDPAKRAALTLKEVQRVANGTAGATTTLGRGLSSLQSDIAGVNAKLAATGIPGLSVQNIFIAIAGSAVTLAVAIGSRLNKAIDAWTKSAYGNTAAVDEMNKRTKQLEVTVGGLAYKLLEMEQGQRIVAARAEGLNSVLTNTDGTLSKNTKTVGLLLAGLVALLPGINLIAIGFAKATVVAGGLSAGLDRLLGTSSRLAKQLRTELVASTRVAARALAQLHVSMQMANPNNLAAAANKGKVVASGYSLAQGLNTAATGAKGRGGGGGGGKQQKTLQQELLELTAPTTGDTYQRTGDTMSLDAALAKAQAVHDKRAARSKERVDALIADIEKLKEVGRNLADEMERAQEAAAAKRTGDAINTVLQSATRSAYGLVDALAAGTLALKDLGAASAMAGGDLIAGLGLDMVSKAVGAFAQKLGSVFAGVGAGFEALASNPLALLGIGAGLVAAGALLKNFGAKSMSGATPSKARNADTSAANAVQALGRNLFAEQDREERTFNLVIGDWGSVRGAVRDMASTTGTTAHYQRELT